LKHCCKSYSGLSTGLLRKIGEKPGACISGNESRRPKLVWMILVDEIHVKHIPAVCFDAMKIALLERFFFWVRDSSSNLRTP
jgi:hypothetical protein